MAENIETRISSEQAKEAIYQAHLSKDAIGKIEGMHSSGSEIDAVVNKSEVSILGMDFYDYTNRKAVTNITKWSAYGAGGSGTPIFDNLSTFSKFGTSLRIGNLTTGVASSPISKIIHGMKTPYDLTDYDVFTIWLYMDGNPVNGSTETHTATSYGTLQLSFGDSYLTNSFNYKILGGINGSVHRGWNNITIRKDAYDKQNGTGCNWAEVSDISLYFLAGNGNVGTTCSFEIIASKLPTYKTPVCITLDDTETDSIEMTNIMNSYGIPVTLFAINDLIDSNATGFMSLSELKNLYNRGNAVCIHGRTVGEFIYTHEKMLANSSWLKENGFTKDQMYLYGSYPNGMYNQASIDYAKAIGLKSLRALKGTIQSDSTGGECSTDGITYEAVANGGIADPFRINSSKVAKLTSYQTELATAISKKAGYISYHHKFSEFVNRAEWVNLAKYLKTKIDDGTIECLTYPKFCKKYSNGQA